VSLLLRQQPTRWHVREVVLHLLVNVVDDGLMQRFLIALQGQDIVGLSVDNLLGNRLLRCGGCAVAQHGDLRRPLPIVD
jgi:hypothetical protein